MFRRNVLIFMLSALMFAVGADAPHAQRQPSAPESARMYTRAVSLFSAGKYVEALHLAIELEARSIAFYGSDSESRATLLGLKGRILDNLGRYEEALQATTEAIRIQRMVLPADHGDLLFEIEAAAGTALRLGRTNDAGRLYAELLESFGRTRAPEDMRTSRVLANLGDVRRRQNDMAGAEQLLERSLSIAQRFSRQTPGAEVAALVRLGALKRDQGALQEAVDLYQRAIAVEQKHAPNSQRIAYASGLMGYAFIQLRRLDEAERIIRRGLAIYAKSLGTGSLQYAEVQLDLATVERERKNYSASERLNRASMATLLKLTGDGSENIATAYNNLGLDLWKQGRLDEAEAALERALTIKAKVLGEHHPSYSDTVFNIAQVLKEKGNYDEALAKFTAALAIETSGRGAQHPDLIVTHNGIGDLYFRQKKWDLSLASFRRSRDIASNWIQHAGPMVSQLGLSKGIFDSTFYSVPVLAAKVTQDHSEQADRLAEEAFQAAQLAQQSSVSSALGNMAARFASGNTPLSARIREHQDLVTTLKNLDVRLIAEMTSASPRPDTIAEARNRIEEIKSRLLALGKVIEREFPAYADLTNPRPMSSRQLQDLLGPDEVMLTYLLADDDDGYVWAATREGFQFKHIPETSKTISDIISKLRSELDLFRGNPGTGAIRDKLFFDVDAAHRLYRLLIGPVEEMVRGKTHIIVSPQAALTSFPLHLLVSAPPPEHWSDTANALLQTYATVPWLIRDHTITVVPSPQSLRALRALVTASTARQPLLGYGNPLFGPGAPLPGRPLSPKGRSASNRTSSTINMRSAFRGATPNIDVLRSSLAPLPETAEELHEVARLLDAGDLSLRLGPNATVADVKATRLDDYRILYFATHALVAGDLDGLVEPALVMSLPDRATTQDNGLLTATEIAQLKLNADWVVLSACNTAAGDKPGAEGLSGLARAFFYAGARALLVTHWPIESTSAVFLMTRIFGEMKSDPGLSRAEALRRAMIAMIDSPPSPLHTHPAFWAPMVIAGDGRR